MTWKPLNSCFPDGRLLSNHLTYLYFVKKMQVFCWDAENSELSSLTLTCLQNSSLLTAQHGVSRPALFLEHNWAVLLSRKEGQHSNLKQLLIGVLHYPANSRQKKWFFWVQSMQIQIPKSPKSRLYECMKPRYPHLCNCTTGYSNIHNYLVCTSAYKIIHWTHTLNATYT